MNTMVESLNLSCVPAATALLWLSRHGHSTS
jgi:hypothetical protein